MDRSEQVFVSAVPYQADHPKSLAVYCSDGRFTEAVEELVRHLGHGRLDTLTVPGGPALLNPLHALYSECEVLTAACAFLIEGHHLEQVVLLAHSGCGHYKGRYFAMDEAFLEARQREDLLAAAQALGARFPRLVVQSYYARAAGGRIRFEPVLAERG